MLKAPLKEFENSESTATPSRQEKLEFLKETNSFINEKVNLFKAYLIYFNNQKIQQFVKFDKEYNKQKHQKLQKKMEAVIKKSTNSPTEHKLSRKVIEDPREGITRRYANYISTRKYQYTEDTLKNFFPNISEQHQKKISSDWKAIQEKYLVRNKIDQDLLLLMYINRFGETDEGIEIYKQFANKTYEHDAIVARAKTFQEKLGKKKTKFAIPGCSAKLEEGLTEQTIIKTHKELFCRRCEIYDCRIHGILDFSDFVSPSLPSSREMSASYLQMLDMYALPEKRAINGKKPCSDNCYLSQQNIEIKIEPNEFTVAKIKLALQVFKFDPCNIRLYFNNEDITCFQIFRFLKKECESTNIFHEELMDGEREKPIAKKESQKPKKNSKKDLKHFFPNWKKIEKNISSVIAIDHHACYHKHYNRVASEAEQSCINSKCSCFKRGFCDKYCGCDIKKCKIRRKGCDCKGNCVGKKCPCSAINSECDPDLCLGCFHVRDAKRTKTNTCQNQMIFFGNSKNCKIGPSEVCTGLGLFNIDPISKGEFVCVYIGELISWEEADMREKWNKLDQETYLCTISDEHVVDAKYKGNKARFINHNKNHANLVAYHFFSKGLYHFAFYAKDDIVPGTELLFDYEGGGSALNEQYSWINNPKSPKNHAKTTTSWFSGNSIYIPLKTGIKSNYRPNIKLTLNANPRKLRKIEQEVFEDLEGSEEFEFKDIMTNDIRYPPRYSSNLPQRNQITSIHDIMEELSYQSSSSESISESKGSLQENYYKVQEIISKDNDDGENKYLCISSDEEVHIEKKDDLRESEVIIID